MVTRGKAESVLSYLAGIVDGEGHIGIDKTKNNPQRRVNPRYQAEVVVVNSDKKLIDWLVENFQGSVYVRKKQKEYHKQTWRWKLGDIQAADLCEQIKPYLIAKSEQAELLIEFVREREPKPAGRGAQLSLNELQRRERIYQQIKILNDWRHPQRLTEGAS